MKRFLTVALSVLTFVSFGAKAELVHSDWKTQDDKMATLDTLTGVEWLKSKHVHGMSVNDIEREMQTSGSLNGWRWATNDEISTLLNNYLSYIYTDSYLGSGGRISKISEDWEAETRLFMAMLERDYAYSADFYLKNENTGRVDQLSMTVNWRYNSSVVDLYYDRGDFDYSNSSNGFMLVSDGGTTLSSQLDPTININNPDSPINQVSVPFFMSGSLALLFIGFRRRV